MIGSEQRIENEDWTDCIEASDNMLTQGKPLFSAV